MPVTVQCFHCNAILDLDDGFRGGVCRCSNCGSLLQVPQGDPPDSPPARKIRPATPPSPTSPITPLQNATSSKLDVGISRGQFESPPSSQIRRTDLGLSSGITGRIHPTTPIAAPSRSKRRRSKSEVADALPTTAPLHPQSPEGALPTAHPAPRPSHALLYLGLLLAFLITAVFVSLIIYYLYFYE